ncbi:MAG: U32 family peptidase [Elusimicrobiales bacterium]|nr:U32 family peptidase [Elusimicrobiales bacterium]
MEKTIKKKKAFYMVGVRSLKEAEYFFNNGADEVYCGIPDMPNHGLKEENFNNKAEIFATIDLAKKLGKRVMIVANDIFPDKNFDYATNMLREFISYGAYGVILRDIALIDYLNKNKIKTHISLSTLSLCFNSKSLDFFVERGVSRIVLPQHLTPYEAYPIFKLRPRIEIEIFCLPLFYEVNINSLCYLSCPCGMEIVPGKKPVPYTCHSVLSNSVFKNFEMPMPSNKWLLETFYDLYNMGADCIKVARGPNINEVIETYKYTIFLTKLLEKGISKKMFLIEGEKIIMGSQNYGKNYIYNPLSK